MRPVLLLPLQKMVESHETHAKTVWVGTDFTKRSKAVETIKRRVFNAFGHDRPGQLLEAGNKLPGGFSARRFQKQGVNERKKFRRQILAAFASEVDGGFDRGNVFWRRRASLCREVGAINRKANDDFGQRLMQFSARKFFERPAACHQREQQAGQPV